MNKKQRLREDAEYKQSYGDMPDDRLGLIGYILGKNGKNVENPIIKERITHAAGLIQSVKWKECEFTMWKVIKPSARPRYSSQGGYIRAYVPHARENGDWFENFFWESDLPTIETPCLIHIDIYEKTPTVFRKPDKVLAEMGLIRPWKRTGDIDNYTKTVLDMMQHGMLAEDCLVIECTVRRFYSIKPKCYVKIKYMEKWPELADHLIGLSPQDNVQL